MITIIVIIITIVIKIIIINKIIKIIVLNNYESNSGLKIIINKQAK